MTRILVPYHLDQYLPDLDTPFPADVTVTVDLPAANTWSRLADLYEPVADAVDRAARDGRPVVLSGDCTTAFGTVAGLQRAGIDPTIVWFDAHGDVQTLETTASGYIGGLALRVLVGYRPELVADRLGLRAIAEERVVLVGARDLDPPEKTYLDGAAIRRVSLDQSLEALSSTGLPDGPVYLHLDLDVVDPGDLPGLLFPAPDGPPVSRVVEAIRQVMDSGRVVAVGLACTWHPGQGASEVMRPHLESALAGLI